MRLLSPAAEKGCLSNAMLVTLPGDTATPWGPEDGWETAPPSEVALGPSVPISQAQPGRGLSFYTPVVPPQVRYRSHADFSTTVIRDY